VSGAKCVYNKKEENFSSERMRVSGVKFNNNLNLGTSALKEGHGLSKFFGKAARLYAAEGKRIPRFSYGFSEQQDPSYPQVHADNAAAAANKKDVDDLNAMIDETNLMLTPDYFHKRVYAAFGINVQKGNEDSLFRRPPFEIYRKHHKNKHYVNVMEKIYDSLSKQTQELAEHEKKVNEKLFSDVEKVMVDMFDTVADLTLPMLEYAELLEKDILHYQSYQDLLPALSAQQVMAIFPKLAEEVQNRWDNDEWLLVDDPEIETEFYKLDVSPSLYIPGTGGGAH